MISNYIKLAFRSLGKRRGNAFLNIAGLTIGMTCCLLIFHYVSYEKSYDDFHRQADEIVRLRIDRYSNGELKWRSARVYPAIAPAMKKDFPEVQDYCRLVSAHSLITNEITQAKFNETKGYFAEPSFLRMFDIAMLRGNPVTALTGPDKMILSESMARKYFGNTDVIGKTLKIQLERRPETYQVTGVFKDYPANSHLDIQYLASYDAFKKTVARDANDINNPAETSWSWYDFYTYIQLAPNADLDKLTAKFPAFCDRYMNNTEAARKNNNSTQLHMMPIKDIHLYSHLNQEAKANGSGQAVGFLFLVSIFIIGIAWINYINLSTARSVERAREVGVRKVLGALRTDLIQQFLTESFLLNIIALSLSLGLFFSLQQPFDRFIDRPDAHISLTPYYWQLFVSLFITGTLLSGMYPAFVLSGFQPIKVLKGIFRNTASGILLRKALIVIQFTTSVVLIAGTIIVYRQVAFMRNQKLGADIDQTLVLQGAGSPSDSLYMNTFQPFKTEILQHSGIKAITATTSVMGQEIYWTNTFRRQGTTTTGNTLYNLGIDQDFIPLYGMKLVAGRNFNNDLGAENKNVLINENAAAVLGFPNAAAAIGQKIHAFRDTNTVVGVLADYHHYGLQKAIDPMIFRYNPGTRKYYSIKVAADNLPTTIAAVKTAWGKHFPADPFSYTFLDETFSEQYKSDILFGKVFGMFAFLAILIACFGLLGLSAYNVIQRTKEIGIRKVLGASAQSILVLLSKDFMKLILMALVLAVPVGWYVMHQWLQDFAYRIHIGWWIFAVAGVLALLIALFTIVLQAARAVTENPVKSLRSE